MVVYDVLFEQIFIFVFFRVELQGAGAGVGRVVGDSEKNSKQF